MPSTQQFRKRIKSVKNTSQITRAMEMVSSVKMQKAVKAILSNRAYMQYAWQLLTRLAEVAPENSQPLLAKREIKRVLLIVAGSDRGLCGSYNSDLAKEVAEYVKTVIPGSSLRPGIQESAATGSQIKSGMTTQVELDVVVAGKKAAEAIRKFGLNLVAEFPSFELDVEMWESRPLAKMAIDGYEMADYDRVDLIYSHFQSSLKQTPVIKQILPIERSHIDKPELWQTEEENMSSEFKLEPDADTVLQRIIPQFLRAQVWGALLESNASEHSARMVAMKNATDNAKDLIADLTLTYNSIRQDSITREISEIAGAAEAMK